MLTQGALCVLAVVAATSALTVFSWRLEPMDDRVVQVAVGLLGLAMLASAVMFVRGGFAAAFETYTIFGPMIAAAVWVSYGPARVPFAVTVAGCAVVAAALSAGVLPRSMLTVVIAVTVAVSLPSIIGSWKDPRWCRNALLGLCVMDIVWWQTGVLDRLVLAGASSGIPVHGAAAIQFGDTMLGVGDLVAAALLAIYASSVLGRAWALGVCCVLQPALMAGVMVLSEYADGPIPATGPAGLSVLLAWAVSARTGAYRSDPETA